jgi:hypothetical protein
MKSLAAFAMVALVAAPASAWAEDEEEGEEEGGDEEPEEPEKKPAKKEAEKPFKKQDLTGHAAADDGKSESNAFERQRFFVDKVDTAKTSKKTLVQGSLTSTTFAYREAGGDITGVTTPSNSPYARLFTDLRLQTDFRHIGGGRWDARIDTRGRFTGTPSQQTPGYIPADDVRSQSGFLGENELEVREMWVARSGKRTDVFFGRQFVADLAGVKFDGLRFDYASSSKFTLLGFGGLYPIRGSRSVFTDYEPLKGAPDPITGIRPPAGRYTGTGGFGAAYRTPNMYGAFGGVAIAPFSAEAPRVFGTSQGYWRAGPKIDFYHFAVLDLLGEQAGLTNLSAGVNFKPDQRLRGTIAVNRVDTETLNVQANAFLADPDLNINTIQNESVLARIAQNMARASISAGLGSLQRFEITVATAFRYRAPFTVASPVAMDPVVLSLPAGKSVEVYGAIVDRRSFKNVRLGVDGSRMFRVGDVAYQNTASLAVRTFVAREFKEGRGEWETEVAYFTTKDDQAGVVCSVNVIADCFGSAKTSALSFGGNIFYRLKQNWIGMGSLFINRYNITSGTAPPDPPVTGLSGFARIAYRF